MLLCNQVCMTSCAKLNDRKDTKFKVPFQVPKINPLFCVLSATTKASENQPLVTKRESRIKLKSRLQY